MAPRTESWVRDYTRVITRFHGVTYLCVIYVSDYTMEMYFIVENKI